MAWVKGYRAILAVAVIPEVGRWSLGPVCTELQRRNETVDGWNHHAG